MMSQRQRVQAWQRLVVAGIVCGWFGQSVCADGTSFQAKPQAGTVEKHADWMARLPGDRLLSQLSLPGTHDTCARYDGFSFGFAKCQTWPLKDQLDAGIRFIDIRCRHVGDRFAIYHGIIDQRISFTEVRDVCQKFLAQHPKECIVMSVKEESTAQKNSRSFAATFAALTQNDGDLWHIRTRMPKLSTVRSRIVLLDRVGTLGGLKWGEAELQDQYSTPLENKSKLIREHFENAGNGKAGQWFINFCSGTLPGRFITPRQYALTTNEVALKYVKEKEGKRPIRLGTVVMDFPGDELIERIVEANFAPRERE